MTLDPSILSILMVEDNPADVVIVEELLNSAACRTDLRSVEDGSTALRYLRKEGEFADATRPDVIWLDLKLPGLNGHEVLREIRQSPGLSSLPVVILSSSANANDVERAYALHANCYFVKEVDFNLYRETLHALVEFWGRRVCLPSRAC